MTWEELKEEAKKIGAGIGESGTIYFSHIAFYKDGGIYFDRAKLDEDTLISSNISPEEMYQIMKTLQKLLQ